LGQATRRAGPSGALWRLLAATALALAAGAALLGLRRLAQDRRWLVTGHARWIWYSRQFAEPAPIRFRAWKDFRIAGEIPAKAPIRFFGDRDWVLEINGARVGTGSQRPGDALRVFDAARLLRPGSNRIAIEASSPDGVGGLLFWMDAGESGQIVSDRSWEVEKLPAGSAPKRRAAEWGRPPIYPWRYPALPGRTRAAL
jgi:hypothetical protein